MIVDEKELSKDRVRVCRVRTQLTDFGDHYRPRHAARKRVRVAVDTATFAKTKIFMYSVMKSEKKAFLETYVSPKT